MFKKSTPQQIAISIAFYASVGGSVVFIALFSLFENESLSWHWVLLPITLFILVYSLVIYFFKKYLHRKIKLIYKTIHQHKVSPAKKAKTVNISQNILEEVEGRVQEWAKTKEAEIDKYKSWAEYRRRFIGDISHELKTPIFNIQGYLHSLLDGGLEDEEVNKKFLKKAANNVDRLHTIVEDLSAISRLETGDLLLEMEEFNIKNLVLEIFEDLELKAKENKLSLKLKTDANQGFLVRADKESIRQVLMNLIVNSIKYGNPGGCTNVGFYDMDKNILIEIADNGIGISEAHLPHVFDRFYRVDKSRSRLKGGSGLGLSIVKHIMEAHKQQIYVRSTLALGSTFGFTLEKV